MTHEGMSGRQMACGAAVGVTATASTALISDDLIRLFYAMDFPSRAGGGCAFVMHPQTLAALISVKDGHGRYLLVDWDRPPPGHLLGLPIREDVTMPRIGPGARSVLFVDFGTSRGTVLCLEHPE